MKILVIGAGVIGSLYGARLARAGHTVSFLARQAQAKRINSEGLTMRALGSSTIEHITNVSAVTEAAADDIFDCAILVVRNEQLIETLPLLAGVNAEFKTVMVNNPFGSSALVPPLAHESLVLAFPGAGGFFEDGVLNYSIVSSFIQPTMVGAAPAAMEHARRFFRALKEAGFPSKLNRDMDTWLLSHAAMVGPMANAIYMDGGDNYSAARNDQAMSMLAGALRENFIALRSAGAGPNPARFMILAWIPRGLLKAIMKRMYASRWAEMVISRHSLRARVEMVSLNQAFFAHPALANRQLAVSRELAAHA